MANLAITNVVNISVATAQTGVGAYNTSNIALFSDEVYANSFGTLGYQIYLSPQQVGVDFGSSSKTYQMAVALFSQQPNILAGGGYLVVIPLGVAVQSLAFSAAPASGTFVIDLGGGVLSPTAAVNWNDTAAQIQAKVQAVSGFSQVVVGGSIASQTLTLTMYGLYGARTLVAITSNTLNASISITPSTTTVGQTIGAAISASVGLVQFFGIMSNHSVAEIGQTDMLAAAAVVQALNAVAFWVSYNQADINVGGMLDLLRSGSFTQSRGLYYGAISPASNQWLTSVQYMAAYAGLAMSTNFNGSNTTQTMHLKALATIQPDPTMTQTILALAVAAGADTYVSIQGVPKVFCSGLNSFWDQVYNLCWFVGGLQVAGFNYLAQSSTKIPQTEQGMDGLKSAYRAVCEQGVTNQYLAPGSWTSSTTFGNQVDFVNNILQRGYYIYSQPVAQQAQTARAARQAPLVQIAAKQAGAIHSSSVIVNINA
jgi:hypothetical protein